MPVGLVSKGEAGGVIIQGQMPVGLVSKGE